ncbi:hypothetical protein C8R44DRAFT_698736 [Mycena epipterygia]|nr:hypothetical protein C8R44DRAFT_698736 [Mycena epipterygia]
MEVLKNRLDSFKQKRGKSLKWPHPKTWQATPETLAEAGFYFDPSAEDPDNATCFMCNKQVTEWAEDDDPFDIHWEKCAKVCAWANLRCGLRRDMDSQGRYVFPDKSRLPTSKAMEKARLETFTVHGWKHDKNRKHMVTSKKMAQAGFVFTPVEADDDTGVCLYCNIALGNWDEDDDPMKHHRDRDKTSQPCPFLALTSDSAPAKQPKTTKRATKAKPLTHTDVVMPTKTYDGSDDEAPVPFPGTVAKTPRKAASSSTAKTPRTTTRSLSRVNLRDPDVPLYEEEAITPPPKKRGRSKSVSRPKVSEDDLDEDRAASPPPPTRQRRPTTAARSRSKSVSRPASALDAANLFDDDDEPRRPSKPEAEPPIARKASRSKSKAREVETDDGHVAEEPVARKPSRSKSKAREVETDGGHAAKEPVARKPPRSKSTTREVEADPDDGRITEEAVSRKSSRSKPKPKAVDVEKEETKKPSSRSQSKPQPPPDDTSSDDGWFVAPIPPPPPAARSRTKSVSRPKGKTQGTDVDEPPAVVSRKEQKKKQRDAAEQSEEPETQRPPSRSQTNAPEAVVDAVVRKPSRTKPKASVVEEAEVKKPASRAKAKLPPPADDEVEDEDEMGMEQYLPPPSSQRPPAVKSRSKPPSKVDAIAEEPKAPRGRKPSSRSTSKPVLPQFELALSAAEAVDEEPEHHEPVAPPPSRTRKASTRSTSTAPPASRSASTTAKSKAKSKRDPSPSPDLLDLDIDAPPEFEQLQPVATALPRQVSKSKPASHAAGPSSSQATDVVQVSTSRKPPSRAPSPSPPPTRKPRPTSQSQPRASHAKNAQYSNEEEHDSSDGDAGDGLPVVDISTDDDEAKTRQAAPKAKGKGKTKGKEKKPKEIRTSHSAHISEAGPPLSQVIDDVDDVEMAEVEESMRLDRGPLPATPPRAHPPAASSALLDQPPQWNVPQDSPEGFSFIPPLATDPFVNIDSLSEAEQEMSVEEWIRYQMGIEYERFKKDGERQLGMFELRAEEVRRAIETL